MTKPHTISTSAMATLSAAARRDDQLAFPPERLPAAAQRAVVRSLIKAGLLREVSADDDQPAWRAAEDGRRLALGITEAGLSAVASHEATRDRAAEPSETTQGGLEVAGAGQGTATPENALGLPVASQRASTRQALRSAAEAVVAAWAEERQSLLPDTMEALRAALAASREPRPPRTTTASPRLPRADTKQAKVLALLRRSAGVSGPAIIEATGWAPHTVRGFLAGLAKKGITVTVLERVRQVGPGKEGAKGSYSIYRIAEAG